MADHHIQALNSLDAAKSAVPDHMDAAQVYATIAQAQATLAVFEALTTIGQDLSDRG